MVPYAARGTTPLRSGDRESRSLLNRALRALNKDPHLVAAAATLLSPSGRGIKSQSIQPGVIAAAPRPTPYPLWGEGLRSGGSLVRMTSTATPDVICGTPH